jgi:peptide/nickel transport system substrate-binding protein
MTATRRELVRGALAAGAACLLSRPHAAAAAGRTPYGGRVVLRVPWPLGRIDPHRLDDAAAACFGDALFDTLYTEAEPGAFAPSLAESAPEPVGGRWRVRLRSGIRFASGARLDARAVAASIERARSRDAGAWLAAFPAPKVEEGALVFQVPSHDPRDLVRALASPLTAVVPPGFAPEQPDGTGPFRATRVDADALLLARNTSAAAGPAFLDAIAVARAPDLAASLRAFESGTDDMGWLGSFLHEPRPDSASFDGGAVGWAVLRTGRDAGSLDAPGTAQALADAVPYDALKALAVGPPWGFVPAAWSGPPCDLWVREDAAWLVDVGRAVAASLSTPSHEVTARPGTPAEIADRKASRSFALLLDVVRPLAFTEGGGAIALATANDPAAARAFVNHKPREGLAPRVVTRTMRLGVVGEIRMTGGRARGLTLPRSPSGRGLDWGNAFWARPSPGA